LIETKLYMNNQCTVPHKVYVQDGHQCRNQEGKGNEKINFSWKLLT